MDFFELASMIRHGLPIDSQDGREWLVAVANSIKAISVEYKEELALAAAILAYEKDATAEKATEVKYIARLFANPAGFRPIY